MTNEEDFKRVLSTGWKVSDPYPISRQEDYVKEMVKELNAIPRQKIPPTKTQAPSTQALLDAQKSRPEWQDKEYWEQKRNTPIPKDAQIRDKDGNVDIAERKLSATEVITAEEARRKSKNTLGQSEASSVTPERRQKGIEAFTYSKPADLTPEQIQRVTKLEEIASTPLDPPKPKKKSLLQKVFGWTDRTRILDEDEFKRWMDGK